MIFECKNDIDLEDLKELTPAAFILFTHAVLFCQEHRLALKITSLKSDRKKVKAVSTTHEEGRAFDISIKGWSEMLVHKFIFETNKYYVDIAAISYSDGIPRAAVYHDNHIHLQVRRDVNVSRFK